MTATSSDLAALYRAVLACPEDDTARLVWADELQECGDHDRAEYVRAGVELAKFSCNFKQTPEQPGWFHDCGTDEKGYWLCQPLRMRADTLRTAHEAAWRRGPKCERCEENGWAEVKDRRGRKKYPRLCPACHGTGWAGSLAQTDWDRPGPSSGNRCWLHKADWSRGLVSTVHATLAEIWDAANNRPSDWAVRVRREWPVQMWVATDREPWASELHEGWYRWHSAEQVVVDPEQPSELPNALYWSLEGEYPESRHGKSLQPYWRTPDLARAALARALAALVDASAGYGKAVTT